MALEAIGSPVLDSSKKIGVDDLIFASRILSSNSLSGLNEKPTIKEKFYAIYLTIFRRKFIAELVKLHAYLSAQSLWPRFWEKESQSSDGGIPWELNIIAGLLKTGCTLDEAWTMPESEAVWLYVASCRINGAKVEVVSDGEWEAMEAYKAEQSSKTYKRN